MTTQSFFYYILDVLSPLGGIKTRKMFGGYGFYKNHIFFALIIEDVLYFKVDDTNKKDYEMYDAQPFSYAGKNGKTIVMSYWQVPVDILDNSIQLAIWVDKAVAAAKRAKKSK